MNWYKINAIVLTIWSKWTKGVFNLFLLVIKSIFNSISFMKNMMVISTTKTLFGVSHIKPWNRRAATCHYYLLPISSVKLLVTQINNSCHFGQMSLKGANLETFLLFLIRILGIKCCYSKISYSPNALKKKSVFFLNRLRIYYFEVLGLFFL